jgi:hypothetical protein
VVWAYQPQARKRATSPPHGQMGPPSLGPGGSRTDLVRASGMAVADVNVTAVLKKRKMET